MFICLNSRAIAERSRACVRTGLMVGVPGSSLGGGRINYLFIYSILELGMVN